MVVDHNSVDIDLPPIEVLTYNPVVGWVDIYRDAIDGSATKYYVRAQDDGYSENEYFYWFDTDGLDTEAPPPVGEYYNLTIVGSAEFTDGVVIVQFIDNRDPLTEPLYRLRAIDSGLSAPGYRYWADSDVTLDNAPTPTGSYSDLTVISIIEVRA